MLSERTERILAQCLLDLSYSEQRVEAMREALSLIDSFTPQSVFAQIDVYSLGSIEPVDLVAFWERLGVYGSESEARMVIQQYDSNADGRLAEADFLQVALPATNPAVRSMALDRRNGSFTREVSLSLTRLTELELSYHRTLRSAILDLRTQGDFSVSAAFSSASLPISTYITKASLRGLFAKARLDFSEQTIDAVLRRLDTDGDERLSYSEFSAIFSDLPTSSLAHYSRSLRRGEKPSPSKDSERKVVLEQTGNSKEKDEDEEVRLSIKSLKSYTRSQSRGESRSSAGLEEVIGARYETGGMTEGRILSTHRDALLELFRERILFWREAESRRRELMMDYDFNLEDAYHLFDPSDKGYLTPSDLESGLYSFGAYVKPGDSRLLISEYSTSSLSRLSFADFCDMLLPFSVRRYGSPQSTPPLRPITRSHLLDVVQLILETERRMEAHRQSLAKLTNLSVGDLFRYLDADRDDNLTVAEVRYFLESNGVVAGERELIALVASLDKNRDGRVTCREFVEALAPKAVERY